MNKSKPTGYWKHKAYWVSTTLLSKEILSLSKEGWELVSIAPDSNLSGCLITAKRPMFGAIPPWTVKKLRELVDNSFTAINACVKTPPSDTEALTAMLSNTSKMLEDCQFILGMGKPRGVRSQKKNEQEAQDAKVEHNASSQ